MSAAAATPLPFSGAGGSASFQIEGRAALPGDPGPHGDIRVVSPSYFETMGIGLIRGRTFASGDSDGAEHVAIIDENLAKLYWPNQDPIGQHIRGGRKGDWARIVGLVAPVRHSTVVGEEGAGLNAEGESKGVYYYPMYQQSADATFFVVRSTGSATSATQALRAAFASVDPNQPISDVKTMDQRIALSLGPRRSAVALLTVFAAMALVLAAIGLFGLVRFNVTQRVQEIGVRMAARSAQPADVLKMLVVQSGRLVLAGIAAGLVATFIFTRAMATQLYGVSPADPVSFLVTAGDSFCRRTPGHLHPSASRHGRRSHGRAPLRIGQADQIVPVASSGAPANRNSGNLAVLAAIAVGETFSGTGFSLWCP